MSLKERILRFHTKKRWPYIVLIIGWFVFSVCTSTTLLLAAVGGANLESQWAPRGSECVVGVSGPKITCIGDSCITGETKSVLIDTDEDYTTDKTITVNATNDIKWCPPPEWFITFMVWSLDLVKLVLIGTTVITCSLVIIRLAIWAQV